MRQGYSKVDIECHTIEATTKRNALDGTVTMVIRCFNVEHESIMENLNFEDVMNYYGVSKVGEWAEGNR